MKYKNIKTGAIIDSCCKIAGGDWVPYEKEVQEVEKVESVEVEPVVTEKVVATDHNESINGVTKKQIMQELDAQGIKYDKNDKKEILYKLMIGE